MAPLFLYTAARRDGLRSGFLCGSLFLLGLGACEGAGESDDAAGDFAESARAKGGREVTLSSSLGPGQSGRVTFSADGDSLLVTVELTGIGAGPHRGFIRHGQSCDAPGAALLELPTVTAGPDASGTASQHLVMPELAEGAALVAYHEPNQMPGHVILCGLITPEAMQ